MSQTHIPLNIMPILSAVFDSLRTQIPYLNLIWNADTCPVSRRGVCELGGMYEFHRTSADTVKSNNVCQIARFVIM